MKPICIRDAQFSRQTRAAADIRMCRGHKGLTQLAA